MNSLAILLTQFSNRTIIYQNFCEGCLCPAIHNTHSIRNRFLCFCRTIFFFFLLVLVMLSDDACDALFGNEIGLC